MRPQSIALLILTLLVVGCQKKKDLQTTLLSYLKEAYVQHWVSGVRGGGAGANIHVFLKQKLPDSILPLRVEYAKRVGNFQKIDDWHYQATILTRKSGEYDEENSATPTILSELEENQAKFFVEVNGKEYFYVIDSIPRKNALAYP